MLHLVERILPTNPYVDTFYNRIVTRGQGFPASLMASEMRMHVASVSGFYREKCRLRESPPKQNQLTAIQTLFSVRRTGTFAAA